MTQDLLPELHYPLLDRFKVVAPQRLAITGLFDKASASLPNVCRLIEQSPSIWHWLWGIAAFRTNPRCFIGSAHVSPFPIGNSSEHVSWALDCD
jgi:hypothetical protein